MNKNKRRRTSGYTSRHMRRMIQRQTEIDILNVGHNANQYSTESSDEDRSKPDSKLPNLPIKITTVNCHKLERDHKYQIVKSTSGNENLTDVSCGGPDSDMSECRVGTEETDISEHESETEHTDPIEITDNREDHDDLENDLRLWALHFNISHKAVSALLVILIHYVTNVKLPKDSRTLLKTPRQTNIQPCSNGAYWHWGLDKALSSIAAMYTKAKIVNEAIKLLVNIDGLPLYKSAPSCLWPILISDKIFDSVFMIGAFYGEDKPREAFEYLESFVTEITSFTQNGFNFMGHTFRIELYAIVCDAPAKSFILNVKNHNGYFSCTKCTIEGSYVNHRICFPYNEMQSPLRTDDCFASNGYEDYQHGPSILLRVPNLKLVSNVPLDCMHLIYLGVVKKILLLLIGGPLTVRLSANIIKNISSILESLREGVPNDFSRLPRPLKYLKDWKATEFRQFVLYTGPIVLNCLERIKPDVYHNFMTLHVAVTILTCPALVKNKANINYAAQLLQQFVKSFGEIYGVEYMSHNIHNLLHVCTDVEKYGTLDSYSAFRFENYLSSVKRKVRSSLLPLQQLARRHAEILTCEIQDRILNSTEISLKNMHNDGPVADLSKTDIIAQYTFFQRDCYSIKCNDERNNCCLLKNGQILSVINIVKCTNKKIYVIGKLSSASGDFYTSPCPSKTLNISLVDQAGGVCARPITDVKGKIWQVRVDRGLVVFPLRHTLAAE